MNFKISKDGTWFVSGSKIERFELVKLFSKFLQKDKEDKYWLVSPYEKIPIFVEDTPFVIKEIGHTINNNVSYVYAFTNTNEKIIINNNNPFKIVKYNNNFKPYIYVKNGMYALVLRSAYYYLAKFIKVYDGWYGFWSDKIFFKIEKI